MANEEQIQELVTSQAVQTERLEQICGKMDKCLVGIYGSGDDPSKGLVVRVDRLEQTKKSLLVGFWTVFTGTIALALNAAAVALGWKH